MIKGVKVIRMLNERAIEFSYKGIVFGMSLDAFNKLTRKDLEDKIKESRAEFESFRKAKEESKMKYEAMTSEQKKEYVRASDALFERWNEYDADDE